MYICASSGTSAVSTLKSDIGTWTFNLIRIRSCNSKSSTVLINDASELPYYWYTLVKTGSYSGAVSSISFSIASRYLDKTFGSKI